MGHCRAPTLLVDRSRGRHDNRGMNAPDSVFVPVLDTPAAVRRTPEFLALNPLAQVPVLQDGDTVVADSNAILVYLARRHAAGSPWLPDEPVAAARVQRWLSLAAGEMKFGPAAARVITI